MSPKVAKLETTIIQIIQRKLAANPTLIPTVEETTAEVLEAVADEGVEALPIPHSLRFWVREAVHEALGEIVKRLEASAKAGLLASRVAAEYPLRMRGTVGPEHDPVGDTRPEAFHLFNETFFPISAEERAEVRAGVMDVDAETVARAWRECPWHALTEINTTGPTVRVPFLEDVERILRKFGTNRVRYSMKEGWVCRDYAAAFAAAYVALTSAAAGIVMDFSGEHSYNAVPVRVKMETDAGGYRAVRWAIIEPQADEVVPNLDPERHYAGTRGFAVLI